MSIDDSIEKRGVGSNTSVLRGTALQSFLANVKATVAELENAIGSLPRVDPDGASDCPFAAELYGRKQELESKLSVAVGVLNAYLAALKAEIERCERNQVRMGASAGRLRTQEAGRALAEAERRQHDELQAAVRDRDAILIIIRRAETTLAVSRSRRPPHGAPSKAENNHGGSRGQAPSAQPKPDRR